MTTDSIAEIARAETPRGELVLRRRSSGTAADVLELRVNGVFVMDTLETTSEIELAAQALDLVDEPTSVLIGGLGLGFTLQRVLSDARVERAVVVEIEDVFFHCAKAFLRSGLWKPETWDPEARVPRRAVIAKEVEPSGMTAEQLDDYYRPENYAKGLYA